VQIQVQLTVFKMLRHAMGPMDGDGGLANADHAIDHADGDGTGSLPTRVEHV
jgi:hypothetical protein